MRRGNGSRQRNAADDAAEKDRADRRALVLQMRTTKRQPWRAIGTELGISHEQARKDYKLAIEEHNAVAREEHRANADAAVRWVVEKMAPGVEAGNAESANVVIRAIALHAKLRGYEAPQEVNMATGEVVIHVSQAAAKAFAPPDDEPPAGVSRVAADDFGGSNDP